MNATPQVNDEIPNKGVIRAWVLVREFASRALDRNSLVYQILSAGCHFYRPRLRMDGPHILSADRPLSAYSVSGPSAYFVHGPSTVCVDSPQNRQYRTYPPSSQLSKRYSKHTQPISYLIAAVHLPVTTKHAWQTGISKSPTLCALGMRSGTT